MHQDAGVGDKVDAISLAGLDGFRGLQNCWIQIFWIPFATASSTTDSRLHLWGHYKKVGHFGWQLAYIPVTFLTLDLVCGGIYRENAEPLWFSYQQMLYS